MIAIIDYKAGNTQSLSDALLRLGASSIITTDKKKILDAEKVILPGVGQAATAYNNLASEELIDFIPNLEQPVLGICLGMQLMAEYNEEGNVAGMGIFNGSVRKFPSTGIIPHMGWNTLEIIKGSLFSDYEAGESVYYAHSYYVESNQDTAATTDYLISFSAALEKNNFYGVQFHPEKSADVGERLLRNFLAL